MDASKRLCLTIFKSLLTIFTAAVPRQRRRLQRDETTAWNRGDAFDRGDAMSQRRHRGDAAEAAPHADPATGRNAGGRRRLLRPTPQTPASCRSTLPARLSQARLESGSVRLSLPWPGLAATRQRRSHAPCWSWLRDKPRLSAACSNIDPRRCRRITAGAV